MSFTGEYQFHQSIVEPEYPLRSLKANSVMKPYKNTFEDDESAIRNFYCKSNVLITGSTGFIGKALTEKLLRTCGNLSKIYCLIRPKRGLTAEKRSEDYLKSSVFDRIRAEEDGERLLSKINCISGDITQPNLGISDEHLPTLLAEVTVVFHVAASVKFIEPLEIATQLNTIGTHKVVLLCRQIRQLKAFIYVSTAFSNADKEEIGEIVYPLTENISRNLYPNDELPSELLKEVGEKLVKNHPNTYTITKAMAEWVVNEYADHIPTAIVRPSIVTAAWKEPCVGWLDNASASITQFMAGFYQGLIRSQICDGSLVADMIPVDILVNTLIVCAWFTSTHRSNAVQVYNCTSGSLNPLKWKEFGIYTKRHVLDLPSVHMKIYPDFTFLTNRFLHVVTQIIFNFMPALLADAYLIITGSKPIMLKIFNRARIMGETCEFFTLHQFNFANKNFLFLLEAMKCHYDREVFNIDVSKLEWDSYIRNYTLAIRTYIFKDPIKTLPAARKKLQRLYWILKGIQVIIAAIVLNLGIKLLTDMVL